MSIRECTIGFGLFVAGAAVGAVAALLTAPRSGKETRRALSREFQDRVDSLSQTGKAVAKRLETALDKSKGFASKLVA